jgi:hypothetical protein
MAALVGLSMRILIFCPVREAGRSMLIHGSTGLGTTTGVEVNKFASGFGVNVGAKVGMGGNVEVAAAVGVAVGAAAWVSATSVEAAANAVLCKSVRLTVGVACGVAPQALMINVITSV